MDRDQRHYYDLLCGILFYVLSPGTAVFLAVSIGSISSMQSVVLSSLGNILGVFLLSSVSMQGLGTILVNSSFLFFLVKVIEASYLVYLGVK